MNHHNQTERTRSIKILLIWQTESDTLDFYRILDPSKEELEMLAEANGCRIDVNSDRNGTTEQAIKNIACRLGLFYNLVVAGVRDDGDIAGTNEWIDKKIHAKQVPGFMGWDRVFVTGVSNYELY